MQTMCNHVKYEGRSTPHWLGVTLTPTPLTGELTLNLPSPRITDPNDPQHWKAGLTPNRKADPSHLGKVAPLLTQDPESLRGVVPMALTEQLSSAAT